MDRFFAIAVNALVSHSGIKRIRSYSKRILDFYIREKKSQSKKEFKNLQFLFLKEIQLRISSDFTDIIDIIAQELYDSV